MGAVSNPDLPVDSRLSWLVETQRFIEQYSIHLDRTKAWYDEPNIEPQWYTSVDGNDPNGRVEYFRAWKAILCPSNPDELWSPHLSLTHYVGITGVGGDSGSLPINDPRSGFFGFDRATRLQDVKRGSSNTIMVSETQQDTGPWTAATAAVRHVEPESSPYLGPAGQFNSGHRFAGAFLGLKEAYGTNVLFVDGSIRLMTADCDASVLEAMATLGSKKEKEPDSRSREGDDGATY
jgi:hypothetical protein